MSKEVVDTAVNLLRMTEHLPSSITDAHTDREPLPGAVGWPSDDNHDRIASRVHQVAGDLLSLEVCRHLTDNYGMRALDIARIIRQDHALAAPLIPGRPEVLAQVDWAVQEEFAATVTDILVRRTQIFYRAFDQGLEASNTIAQRMALLLGWDAETTESMIQAYADVVAESRAWKSDPIDPKEDPPEETA